MLDLIRVSVSEGSLCHGQSHTWIDRFGAWSLVALHSEPVYRSTDECHNTSISLAYLNANQSFDYTTAIKGRVTVLVPLDNSVYVFLG